MIMPNTYYIAGIPFSDELYHHGIKGQKWGIRRYQNPDGTLTSAGKQRYAQTGSPGESKSKSDTIKKVAKTAAIAAGTAALAYGGYKLATSDIGREAINSLRDKTAASIAKSVAARQDRIAKRMSDRERVKESVMAFRLDDKELLRRIERLQKEADYRRLVRESFTSSPNPKTQIMINAGKKTAETVLGGAGVYGIKALLTKKIDPRDAANYLAPKPKNK